ncbi:ANR family transcriptional regulator [Escherichia coli]|nr:MULTISPECIES: ANR family transcriptional regulator [Enterobacteriaceae]MCX9932098.1 ANR family transcriptional regulator [Escherichia coli]UUK71797.1 ANR family transcriptional regulator [Escherichia albertii]
MNGTGRDSQNSGVWRYRQVGRRAVRLEVRGDWPGAAEAWLRAAQSAPRTDWQQFARKRAEHCHRRCREGCNEKAAFITPGIQKAE